MLHTNLMALCFIESESLPLEFYIAGIRIFDLVAPDLDLDTMTFIIFICEFDRYCMEIYRICALCKALKVIV